MSAPLASAEPLAPRGDSQWSIVVRQFRRNRAAVWGLRVAFVLVALAIYAPLIASSHPLLWRAPGQGLSSPWAERLFDVIAWEHGVDRFFNSLMVTLTIGLVLRFVLRRTVWRSGPHGPSARRTQRIYLVGAFLLALVQAADWAFTRSLPTEDYRAQDPSLVLQGARRARDWALAHLPDEAVRARVRGLAPEGFETEPLVVAPTDSGGAEPPLAFPAAALAAEQAGLLEQEAGPAGARAGEDAVGEERRRLLRESALALRRASASLERAGRITHAARVAGGVDGPWALRTPIPYGYREKLDGREEAFARSFEFGGGARHVLGTDGSGGDVLARILYGTRISLTVGILAVAIYVTIGTILGGVAGYVGRRVDLVIMRIVEVIICIPPLFLLMTLVAFVDAESRSIFLIMVAIGVVSWTGVARLIRGQVLRERALDYVTAARALGCSPLRILFRHVLPNAFSPVLVAATFGVASAILTESTLSFIGLGDISVPSWGRILNDGREYGYWHLILPPSVAIFVTVTALNLVGDGVRDALDPKLRN